MEGLSSRCWNGHADKQNHGPPSCCGAIERCNIGLCTGFLLERCLVKRSHGAHKNQYRQRVYFVIDQSLDQTLPAHSWRRLYLATLVIVISRSSRRFFHDPFTESVTRFVSVLNPVAFLAIQIHTRDKVDDTKGWGAMAGVRERNESAATAKSSA